MGKAMINRKNASLNHRRAVYASEDIAVDQFTKEKLFDLLTFWSQNNLFKIKKFWQVSP